MKRYLPIPRTKSWCGDNIDWDAPPLLGSTIEVNETQTSPIATGVLDLHGVEFFRIDDRPRMGFDTTGATMGVLAKGNRAKAAKKGMKVAMSPKVAVPAKSKNSPKKSMSKGKC